MKVSQLVTTLACLLSLAGCITMPETLADSDASMGDDPESVGQAATIVGGGAGGAAGDGIVTGGVGGGAAGEGSVEFAGTGGNAFGAGGGPAPVDPSPSDAGAGLPCLDGTSNPCTVGTASDAAVNSSEPQLGTRSSGCELLAGTALCMGEGWMLADGESIPDCGRSGAYRICTFEGDACVSHTVMMVQRCD